MQNAVWFISYKLVDGASVPDFLQAQEKCNNEVLSKQPGFISWKVLVDGDTWVDLVTWETKENAINAENNDGDVNPVAQKFYSFIDPNTLHMQCFTVERIY
jgi:hypothetical protein